MSVGRVEIPGENPGSEEGPSFFADLMVLTKVRLSFLVLVTTLTGFWYSKILSGAGVSGAGVLTTGNALSCFHVLLGTALAAFSAAALNQSYEGDVDSRMERTKDRPVPAGRIGSGKVFLLGFWLGVAGFIYLAFFSGWKTAGLGALTIVIYVWVYTPMKQRSFAAVFVGAVSGALPPLMGWVAAGGKGWWGGGVLFCVLLFWQMPHFLAIAWLYRDEYEAAGLRMLPADDPQGERAGWISLVFALLLTGAGFFPWLTGMVAGFHLPLSALLNFFMVGSALVFLLDRSRLTARRLFFASIVYLPLHLALFLCSAKG
jgi:protoheme IX farnesyltransferase